MCQAPFFSSDDMPLTHLTTKETSHHFLLGTQWQVQEQGLYWGLPGFRAAQDAMLLGPVIQRELIHTGQGVGCGLWSDPVWGTFPR